MADEPSDSPLDQENAETLDASDAETLETGGLRASAPAARLPETIGEYRILGLLGEGGMGVVFEAQQLHPKRRVALKVIRGSFVDELQIRMFQREVDTLARLRHPNIGGIYAAGRTEGGQHFFAMELVEGETLRQYLARRPAATERREIEHRLRILRKVADAVHYAHQRGVIHRDLKPSNIIVTASGDPKATPEVKILDFGLARMTDQEAQATLLSQAGSIKGTLPYMSPEQARGETVDLDLRTDVYALGVILYEMLVGALPYDTQAGSLITSIKVICEEPPRPLRLAWTGVRRVDPDLETIVGKALEKDARDRYGSAAALSDDVERFLTSQPIQARPPSAAYQLRKLVARNKLAAAFAATVLALLVGFGIWMSVLFGRALRAETQARQEAETARQVSDFMVELFEVSDPSEARGNQITAREILDRGAERIEEELSGQPAIEARLLRTVGSVYHRLGLYQPAEPLLEKALELSEATLGPEHPDLARALDALGVEKADLGKLDEAEALLERALRIRQAASDSDTSELAETARHLAAVFREQGKLDEAEGIFDSLLPLQERLLGPEHPEVARTVDSLAAIYHDQADYVAFEEACERGLRIREATLEPDHPEIGGSLHRLGDAYKHMGKLTESESVHQRALAIRERVLGPEHPETLGTMNNLAGLYLDQRRFAEAQGLLERVVERGEATFGPEHYYFGTLLASLGFAHLEKGEPDAAAALTERALAIMGKSLGPDSYQLPTLLNNLGEAYWRLGRTAEAEVRLERATRIEAQMDPEHPEAARTTQLRAHLHRDRGETEAAQALYERALPIFEKLPDQKRTLGQVLHDLGGLHRQQGRREEALALFQRALRVREEVLGPQAEATRESRTACVTLLRELGRESEAERLDEGG